MITRSSRIEAVKTCVARIPLDVETNFATRRVGARDYCLVRVTTSDGVEGIGFCYAGSTGGSVVAAAVRDVLAPVLIGQDPHRIEGIWQDMYQEALLHGRAGSAMRALSILDIALWDRNARACQLPLWRMLGSTTTTSVPAYASGGYYIEGKSPKMLAREMIDYVESGFSAVKMKVGKLDPASEEERISAVRDAIGPDVLLMLDANNAWRDLPTAMRYISRYEPYDPYWIEEPFSPDDIENHARLAAATHITVATGEIEAGRWRFKELLDKDAAGILQADAAVCGGISEWRRIAATAASYEVTVSPHWFHDLHVHLVAATPNARFVEYFPDDQVLNFRRLVGKQLEAKNGQLLLTEEPGLGFDFDEQSVSRYSPGGWQETR